MFCKLALRNVRRSFRDYGVYLLTLTFGVCLFYTFSSLDGQGAMIYLTQSQNPMAQVIQSCIDVFSVFVAVVLAGLILYADRFLMRRRKRELGTYLLLGLSQGQVSLLLVLETGLIGAASLALRGRQSQQQAQGRQAKGQPQVVPGQIARGRPLGTAHDSVEMLQTNSSMLERSKIRVKSTKRSISQIYPEQKQENARFPNNFQPPLCVFTGREFGGPGKSRWRASVPRGAPVIPWRLLDY